MAENLTTNHLITLDHTTTEGVQTSESTLKSRQNFTEIEITINKTFDNYTADDQKQLLRAISLFLEIGEGELKIVKKRRGSVKLTFYLPHDKAEKLFQAIKLGQFEDYGIVDAELKEPIRTTKIIHIPPTEEHSKHLRGINRDLLPDDEFRQEMLETLIRDYRTPVLGYCRMLVGDDYLAEEIMLEVFVTASQGLPKNRPKSSLRTWLFGIARRKCQQAYRDQARRQRIAGNFAVEIQTEGSTTPEALQAYTTKLAQLNDSLARLSSDDQILLTFWYWKQLSVTEIAEIMGITEAAVRRALTRALKRLRDMMGN